MPGRTLRVRPSGGLVLVSTPARTQKELTMRHIVLTIALFFTIHMSTVLWLQARLFTVDSWIWPGGVQFMNLTRAECWLVLLAHFGLCAVDWLAFLAYQRYQDRRDAARVLEAFRHLRVTDAGVSGYLGR